MSTPTSTTTRSRSGATKRPSTALRQRAGSSDSMDGTSTSLSVAGSYSLDVDEMNSFDTNGTNNNHNDMMASSTTPTNGTGTTLNHKNSLHSMSSTHSSENFDYDVEAASAATPGHGHGGPSQTPSSYMHRSSSTSSSLAPMEIRTISSPKDDDNNNNNNSNNGNGYFIRRLRSFTGTARSPSSLMISVLENPSEQTGRLLVLAASAIYGTNFATVKLLDDVMPLSLSAMLRFSIAAGVVAAFVLGRERDDVDAMVGKERNLAFWSGAEIGLWYSIGYLAQAEGLQTVSAGKSAFFNALAVIVVPILDALVKGKILKHKEIASVLLACFGVGLLEVGPEGFSISPGDILAFMQMIFFGIGYWRLEAVSHAHPHQAARVTVGQLSAVAAGATVYFVTEYGLGHVDVTFDHIAEYFGDPFIMGALLWTGLISTALALYLETVALKVVSATELTLLMTTTSLWGASFAYVTIGEVLSTTGMIGGLLILAGCGLSATTPLSVKEG
mmetsp:Transcript_58417/g.142876  ORF Transcript_58417/g.142876 Transcript_58417/m.142876 type:complete len:501 (+) Transcript_58417:280-1782(+)